MSAAIISGEYGILSVMEPNMDAAPISDTVMDPVAVVKTADKINGNINPRYGMLIK